MVKCFISHTWANDEHTFAVSLRDALLSRGIDVWLDEDEIAPGEDILQRMRDGVRRENDVFLFILSPSSLKSISCKFELKEAIHCRDEFGLQIIPIILKSCDIPDALCDSLFEDFRDSSNFEASVDKLLAGIEKAAPIRLLVSKLNHGDPDTRADYAKYLGEMRSPYTVPVLRRHLFEDEGPIVKQWCAISLGKIGTKDAIEALLRAKDQESHPLVLDAICSALREANVWTPSFLE